MTVDIDVVLPAPEPIWQTRPALTLPTLSDLKRHHIA